MYKFVYKNIEIKGNIPIASLSSLNVGGKALFFTEVFNLEQLKTAFSFARERALRIFFLGDGTNILFSDRFFPFFLIKNSIKGIKKLSERKVEVFAATSLGEFLDFLEKEELKGYEELSGIPGSVGGAVYGNAGAFGREIKDYIEKVISITKEGESIEREKSKLRFAYRWSLYKEKNEFIYKIIFKLPKGEKSEISKKRKEIIEYRKKRLPENPPKVKSAGSFFKNILLPDGKKIAVGAILEKIGAKNIRVGDAAVSQKHANFLINTGKANASDFIKLSSLLKQKVKEEGYEIEEEVIIVDRMF